MYQKAGGPFAEWALQVKLDPRTPEEWDDALVEWKQSNRVSKAEFETCRASLEFFNPRLRGQLKWAAAVTGGWNAEHVPKHTVPMCRGPAALISAHLSSAGHPRLGIGVSLQNRTGLRPSELLGIKARHVLFPLPGPEGGEPIAVIRLGASGGGTKAKREQFAILRRSLHPDVFDSLRDLVGCTDSESLLFPYSYRKYGSLLKTVCASLKIGVSFTPHSPRAGFATDGVCRGMPITEIKAAGRWKSETSFLTYIDVVQSLAIDAEFSGRHLAQASAWCLAHLRAYFPQGVFGTPRDGEVQAWQAAGVAQGGRRSVAQHGGGARVRPEVEPNQGPQWTTRGADTPEGSSDEGDHAKACSSNQVQGGASSGSRKDGAGDAGQRLDTLRDLGEGRQCHSASSWASSDSEVGDRQEVAMSGAGLATQELSHAAPRGWGARGVGHPGSFRATGRSGRGAHGRGGRGLQSRVGRGGQRDLGIGGVVRGRGRGL